MEQIKEKTVGAVAVAGSCSDFLYRNIRHICHCVGTFYRNFTLKYSKNDEVNRLTNGKYWYIMNVKEKVNRLQRG